MSAYVVFEAKVSDAEKFSDYAQQAPDLVSRFGPHCSHPVVTGPPVAAFC